MINGYDENLISMMRRHMTYAKWVEEGTRLFGERSLWRFVCPTCHKIIMMKDYYECGTEMHLVPRVCIVNDGEPCYDLPHGARDSINPVTVKFDNGPTQIKVFGFYYTKMVLSHIGMVGRVNYINNVF